MKQLRQLYRYHPTIRCYPNAAAVSNISILEVGPGRGDFLFELARAHPDQTIGAIEIKRKRFEKLIPRLKRQQIESISLLQGDARVVLPRLFRSEQLQKIYILFSDPWPKQRHDKHRLFQSFFIDELFRILQPGGTVVVAHDDPVYLRATGTEFNDHAGFVSLPVPEKREELFQTFYAQKWRDEGRTLEALSFQKQSLLGWERFRYRLRYALRIRFMNSWRVDWRSRKAPSIDDVTTEEPRF